MKDSKKVDKIRRWPRFLSMFLFITLILSIFYVIIKLINAPLETDDIASHTKSDYTLMLLQCTLGLIVMFFPAFLERRLSIIFPGNIYSMYLIFLYCAIYLGEVRDFYYVIPFWDSILHAFSGAMLGALGFAVINILNEAENITLRMSPIFVSLFALCFATTLGVIWEIYEFSFDGLLGLNMQKYAEKGGNALVGRNALNDTMKDLIIDFLSAFLVSVTGYFFIKRDRSWVLRFKIVKTGKKARKSIKSEDEL